MDTFAVENDAEELNVLLPYDMKKEDDDVELSPSLQIRDTKVCMKEEIGFEAEHLYCETSANAENRPDKVQLQSTVSEELYIKEEILSSEKESHKPRNFAYAISKNIGPESPKLHKCQQCIFTCYLSKHYIQHSEYHKRRVNQCEQCGYETKTKSGYIRHIKWQHRDAFPCHSFLETYEASEFCVESKKAEVKEMELELPIPENYVKEETVAWECLAKSYKCKNCEFVTYEKDALKLHAKETHPLIKNTIYTCSLCNYSTLKIADLAKHKKRHRKEGKIKNFICDCGYRTCRETFFKIHQKRHELTLQCKLCSKYLTASEFRMQQHLKAHAKYELAQSKKLYVCTKCKYRTSAEYQLRRHMMTHSPMRNCNKCEQSFRDKASLLKHKKTHLQEESYQCRTSKRLSALKISTVTHTGEKPYSCNECGYQTTCSSNLKRHEKAAHAVDVKLYPCEESNVARGDYLLKRHRATHSTERLYNCTECERTFKNCGLLNKHKKVHLREDRFRCCICGYSAPNLGFLKIHSKIHTRGKPFSCHDCDYSTAYKRELDVHQRMVHLKLSVHQCQMCGYSTTTKRQLRKHKLKHAREKASDFQRCKSKL